MEKIAIKIAPTADVRSLLADEGDTEFGFWLGCGTVPESAARRLDRLQEIVTERILGAIDGATVTWSSENMHVGGAVKSVHVSIDDDEDEGFAKEIVEDRVNAILDRAIVDVLEEEEK